MCMFVFTALPIFFCSLSFYLQFKGSREHLVTGWSENQVKMFSWHSRERAPLSLCQPELSGAILCGSRVRLQWNACENAAVLPATEALEGGESKPLWSGRGKDLAGIFFRTRRCENLPVPAVEQPRFANLRHIRQGLLSSPGSVWKWLLAGAAWWWRGDMLLTLLQFCFCFCFVCWIVSFNLGQFFSAL